MIVRNFTYLLLTLFIMSACSGSSEKKESSDHDSPVKENEAVENPLTRAARSVYTFQTYDGERLLEKGRCFLLTNTTLVAPFSKFNGATRAEITPLNGGTMIPVSNFYNFDRINNLILLAVDTLEAEPLKLYGAAEIKGVKTYIVGPKKNNTQALYTGSCLQEKILQGRKLYSISNVLGKTQLGTPVLVSNGSVLGMGIAEEVMYENQYFAVPASEIIQLVNKRSAPKPLASINAPNAKRNAAIKRIILETDYGNIAIQLYNETPAYRDNFVQLSEEGFYDSLLIHRVIRDFGIQMGAADTRHAKADDIVGWKGPGYTIPAHILPDRYHKRGAIGSPRKPDDKNKQKRSDGSQFYIVTGRKYLPDELDELEKEKGITFSSEQREIYSTVGGAPHLDGEYTVFGEVISGLEVADRISLFPVKGDFRPISDIRLNKVSIIY